MLLLMVQAAKTRSKACGCRRCPRRNGLHPENASILWSAQRQTMTDKGLTRWDPFISGRTFGYIARVVRSHSAPPFLQPQGCGCRKETTSLFTNQSRAKRTHVGCEPRDFQICCVDEVHVWRCLLIPKTLATTDNGRRQRRSSPSKKANQK